MVRPVARRKSKSVKESGNGHLRLLTSFDAVMTELGPPKIARLTGVSAQAVCNWKSAGKKLFPSAHFLVMRDALHKKGFDAPPELWRINSPRPRRD